MTASTDRTFVPGQRQATRSGFSAPEGKSVAERLDEFLAANPSFVDLCADYTRTFMRRTGAGRVGFQAVLERVRWERQIELKSDDFKVNNSFEPYLSRLVMALNRDLDGVYATRKAPLADEWLAQRPEISGQLFSMVGLR